MSAPAALGDDQGRISGRVLGGPAAVPLADAGVELFRELSPGAWQRIDFVWTGADGRYRFDALAADTYRVCAKSEEGGGGNSTPLYLPHCWRNAPTVDSADDVVVGTDAAVGGVSVRLPMRARIRGHVTDSAGAPVTGGYARSYWQESGHWVYGPWSSFQSDGSYELRVDGGRPYHVCFHPSEVDPVATECWDDEPSLPVSTAIRGAATNRTIEGIDAQLGVAGRISGLIDEYPTGTQGSIAVNAFRDDGNGLWTVGWTVAEPWTSPMPYEIGNLPAGTYRVCFSSQDYEFFPVFADECVGGYPSPETGTEIEVVAGEVTPGADVEVGQASRIRGRVTGIDAPVWVELLTASGELIYKRLTLADGTYGFDGLPNGSYRMAFNRVPGETRLAARFYRNKPEHTGIGAATPVELGDGAVLTGISTGLVAGGSVTGRIVDPAGAGVPGCQVRAHTLNGALVTRWSDTDATGAFDVGGLTTGAYRLAVSGGTCGIGNTLHYDTGTPSRLTPNESLGDSLAVTIGAATAVPDDLVVTEVRNLAGPSITGTPQAGQPLSADPGTWAPADAALSYRWLVDGVPAPGETGPTYTPGPSQVGSRIRVRVTASKPGYTSAARNSASTAPVASAP